MKDEWKASLKQCSRCGTCQAYCPLYQADGREIMVARGKMELLDRVCRGELSWSKSGGHGASLDGLFSLCLQCGACSANCPNGVEPHKLIAAARQELAAAGHLSPLKKGVFRHLLPHRGRMEIGAKLLYLYQRGGAQKILRAGGLWRALGLAGPESLLPASAGSAFRRGGTGGKGPKVAYFMGCMTSLFFHETGQALWSVLESLGVAVAAPAQFCCGMPARFSGAGREAERLAKKNIAAFRDADFIVTDCASCLGALKEYGDYGPGGAEIAAKALDFSDLLVNRLDFRAAIAKNGEIPVTYHDPCHLKWLPGGREAPRELIKRLAPAYRYREAGDDVCCGAAGSFSFSHYELAKKVGDRKGEALVKTGAALAVTSCPACLIQLRHILKDREAAPKAAHIAVICADAMGLLGGNEDRR